MEPYQVTVVSHTHWDRAWYVTFQEFRARLVRLIDRLLCLLEKHPEFRVFTLDGQMAILEDYLEVRPQRQGELEALCKQGRIKIGPWYVLADEFLVSPEALIRNLMLGHRLGEHYGGVSKIGYVPDGFGHTAQLPQILRGFGIDNAFFWRGLGEEGEHLGTEFTWKAPDGSDVTAIWMPFGYHNISNLGYPIHWGDTSQMQFDPELALFQIQKAVEQLTPYAHTGALLLMNGIDHEEAEERVPEVLDQANDLLTGAQFFQGTLIDHLNRVRSAHPVLPEYSGEFRWGKYAEILQGVYATRIYLKQANQRVENLVERYSEPLAAIAWLSGVCVPEGTQDLIWAAWRWLLKNHPHDDIYGSGIDPVHEEMMYRFSQAEQISRLVVRDSLRQIARQADFTAQTGMPVIVYNPLSWPRQEIATGDLDIDFDDPLADRFQLVDPGGKAIPCQVLDDQQVFWMETLKSNRKRRLRVAFPANVPACGYASYYVQPAPEAATKKQAPETVWELRPDGAENAFLSFHITPDGGLDVMDKASGKEYTGLNHLEDVDDAGDEYSYSPCLHSQTFSTRGQPAHIRLSVSGPNLAIYETRREFKIPASLSVDRQSRSVEMVDIPVVSRITIYRDMPGLYIETEVVNLAQDHLLGVVFPTDLYPDQVYVDESFTVMPRPVDLPSAEGWVEQPTPLMHQRSFIDLSQDGHGLAVLNRGLPAVDVSRLEGGTQLRLILLRCVGWLSRDDLSTRKVAAGPLVPTPGAQCLGKHRVEYAILPHQGDWREVYQVAFNYISPLLVTRADTHEGLDLHEMNITRDDPAQVKPVPWPREGENPGTVSFLESDSPNLVLSALYRTQDGQRLIARFYNIFPEPVNARVSIYRAIEEAWLVNMNEQRQERIVLENQHMLALSVQGNQVVTVEIVPKE